MSYYRNNIIFRIASADAIGKLKTAQSHAFQQLLRKEFNFDDSAKEGVLLQFDIWSNWIFRVEKICLNAGEGELSLQLRKAIFSSFAEELKTIFSLMESHPDVFSEGVCDFTKVIHSYAYDGIGYMFEENLSAPADLAFVKLTNTISNYLQHYLISMHEFNNNIVRKTEQPFLSMAHFCLGAHGTTYRFHPCLQRAKFFERNGCGSTFIFKNYTQENIFAAASAFLSSNGITIIPEEIHSEALVSKQVVAG